MVLHELLDGRRSEVLTQWLARVQASVGDSLSPVELVDHIPEFLEELIACLRAASSAAAAQVEPASAVTHGENRLRLGFSLDAVVREYGLLVDAIFEIAQSASVTLSVTETRRVLEFTTNGIARAVSEYSAQRDADFRRQANEHFAFVAHELRNPLSAAVTALNVLQQADVIPATHPATAALQRALTRTTELVDQSLRLARVSSGVDLKREPTTLAALFEIVQSDALPAAAFKGVDVRIDLRQDTMVELDVRLVRSALDNLVRNAIKHTPTRKNVDLRGDILDGRAVIEIEDCCGGIDRAEMEDAFTPFVRLDTQQSGFGLGLAIAKLAVDAHAGNLRVQNLPGKGCLFVMSLPIADRVPAQLTAKTDAEPAAT